MKDLFSEKTRIRLPTQYGLMGRVCGNMVCQIACSATDHEFDLTRTDKGFLGEGNSGEKIAFIKRGASAPKGYPQALRIDEAATVLELANALGRPSSRWLSPRPANANSLPVSDFAKRAKAVRASWKGALHLREEVYDGNKLVSKGFRPPQIGAIHAVKAHWVVSDAPATLVMPTGTGKTESMLALLVSEQIERLLVIVPSDALRSQIAGKFTTLGVLKASGCLDESALFPVVATLKRAPTSVAEIDELFDRSQVIVATMQAISRLPSALQDHVAGKISHLFVDEAHHIGASTWKTFKTRFTQKRRKILQFTATPYRNDNRRVDGKFIFVYPLKRAQEQHLFRPVNYEPVLDGDPDRADLTIISKVGAALDADLAAKFDHLAMARTSSIARAAALLELYGKNLPRYKAAMVHSRMGPAERAKVLEELRTGAVRIIVCVNMLGEGFDLPRLKIAGLHDRHRSEAVTLQFIGRFTRNEPGLGDATVIAKVSLEDPREWLNALYREDADWNTLLHLGSAMRVEHQRQREELYSGLDRDFETIPTETVTPKLNAFVFRTKCSQWTPEALFGLEKPSAVVVEGPIVNAEIPLVMTVMRHEDRLRWSRVNHPSDVVYNLIMAHWDQEQALLYIHSSTVEGMTLEAAKLLCGEDVEPLRGEAVFRVLHGYRRVMLTNLGVRETHIKPIRFQLSTGIDITEQLEATIENRSRIKTNLFGSGYCDEPLLGAEGDESQSVKRSIGCSIKGKIWSQDGAVYPGDWVEWCKTIGPKIANETIKTDMVLRNVLRPKRQHERPENKIPLSIDWPEGLTSSDEDRVTISFDGMPVPMSECDIAISSHTDRGPIEFQIRSEKSKATFAAEIKDGTGVFRRTSSGLVTLSRGKSTRDITELFREDPPTIRFTDGSMLIGADLAASPGEEAPYFDTERMLGLDWGKTDITKESQGPARTAGTVQRFVIDQLLKAATPYDLIFDGDASGEVADVIAIRRQGRFLDVELYHCKFSSDPKAGARVDDLYEVCGQAMKAVKWADPRSVFLQRLRKQEDNRQKRSLPTRFEIGDRNLLDEWLTNRRELATRFSMVIVQPGYSKSKSVAAHQTILGAVRSYLSQTYNIDFSFWSNK